MQFKRRTMFTALAAAPLLLQGTAQAQAPVAPKEEAAPLYGLIGKFKAAPGRRDELAQILLNGTQAMPGCLSYIIANDPKDPDSLWITEVWDSRTSHKASLGLPAVKEAIAKGRPMIAGIGERFETVPLGGHGLAR
jgi:quinol monooxygenase YgiN